MIYTHVYILTSLMSKNMKIYDSLKNNYVCNTTTAKEYKHLTAGVVVVTFSTPLEDSYRSMN